ncbi:MAG TPA: DUF262 domain-containing HNH endonuclease family protein [Anaerolineaceae bacterium]|nr:DUF262 domain-containing HNH endonuclease family protein [Anaerolineaceae bacterium]
MDCDIRTVVKLLEPQRLNLEIPDYQRPYSWRTSHREDFWHDIRVQAERGNPDSSHFFGSLVLNKIGNSKSSTFSVIDGQQRIVTTSIFLNSFIAVLRSFYEDDKEKFGITFNDVNDQMQDLKSFIKKTHYHENPEYDKGTLHGSDKKLHPMALNQQDYYNLVDFVCLNKDSLDNSRSGFILPKEVRAELDALIKLDTKELNKNYSSISTVYIAFKEFYKYIHEYLNEATDKAHFLRMVRNLSDSITMGITFAVIELDDDDKPQEIFESLNARMEKLSPSDLIKNFIMMSIESADNGSKASNKWSFYQRYWKHFEDKAEFWLDNKSIAFSAGSGVNHLRSFLYYLLLAETSGMNDKEFPYPIELNNGDRLYRAFRAYIDILKERNNDDLMQFVEKIDRLSKLYKEISEASTNPTVNYDASDNGYLYNFTYRVIEAFGYRPLWTVLIKLHLSGEVETAQVKKAVSTIENWAVRRLLAGYSGTADLQTFTKTIMAKISTPEAMNKPGDVIAEFLDTKDAKFAIWPNNSFLEKKIDSCPFNSNPLRKKIRVVLEAIEDYERGFDRSGVIHKASSRVPRGALSIEHIMPQKWNQETWPAADENDYSVRNEKTVHLLGNLTLLSKPSNSSVSNKSWEDKKEGLLNDTTGLQRADIKMFDSILKEDNWAEKEIAERTRKLLVIVEEIWEEPSNQFTQIATGGTTQTTGDFIQKVSAYIRDQTSSVDAIKIYPNAKNSSISVELHEDGTYMYNDMPYTSLTEVSKALNKKSGREVFKSWYYKDEENIFGTSEKAVEDILEKDKFIKLSELEKKINLVN